METRELDLERVAAADSHGRAPGEQELRLALVMNGGVSLAVWIGGVSQEVLRLTRRHGVYGQLLALTHARARVDVISGTSAGGINGACLAMALAHGSELDGLRDLWVRSGAFQELLRSPFQADPPSLLEGDEYLLKELGKAFRSLWKDAGRPAAESVPLDLTITTTLLRGQSTNLWDDFGTLIADVDHRARFRFRRGAGTDPFTEDGIVDRLALAGRCTSSFPGAFEASYCPIGSSTDDPPRPDMSRWASFEGGRKHGAFVIDGGVLNNKPLEPALEAIFAQRSDGNVRRVLAYVVPDPGQVEVNPGDDPAHPPSAAGVVLASLVNLPRVESVRDDLESVRRRNVRVWKERENRVSITGGFRAGELEELSRVLFQLYCERRRVGAVLYQVELFAQAVRQDVGPDLDRRGLESIRRVLAACFGERSLPWIPTLPPTAEGADKERSGAGWTWGVHALEHFVVVLFETLRRTQRLAYRAGAESADLARCWSLTYAAHDVVADLRADEDRFWKREAREHADRFFVGRLDAKEPPREVDEDFFADIQGWAFDAIERWEEEQLTLFDPKDTEGDPLRGPEGLGLPQEPERKREALTSLAHALAQVLRELVSVSRPLAREALQSPNRKEREEAKRLVGHAQFLVGDGHASSDELVRRMLVLEIVQYALGGDKRDVDQIVELIQVSGDVPNAFDGRRAVAQKLAGVQLGHFGAFYKASWRANDWMFGRLDGCERLVQVLLDPERLRQVYGAGSFRPADIEGSRSERVAGLVREIALGPDAEGEARALLEEQWDGAAVLRELSYLDDPRADVPEFLPACVRSVVRRLQLDVIRDELPVVARAVEEDLEQGGDRAGAGAAFMRGVRDAQGRGGPDPGRRLGARAAVDLFRQCRVGAERIDGEIGTDLFAKTVSHAVAVTSTLGTGKRSGLGWLRFLFRAVSLPAVLLYLMVRNAVGGSRVGPVLNALALGVGLTIVALDLLVEGTDFPSFVSGLGVALVVAGVGFLLLMSRWFVPLILAAVATAAILFGTGTIAGGLESWIAGLDLGSLPAATRSVSLGFGVALAGVLSLWIYDLCLRAWEKGHRGRARGGGGCP